MDSTKDRNYSNQNPFGTKEELFFAFMEMKSRVEEVYED
jgi:hypothetical protein